MYCLLDLFDLLIPLIFLGFLDFLVLFDVLHNLAASHIVPPFFITDPTNLLYGESFRLLLLFITRPTLLFLLERVPAICYMIRNIFLYSYIIPNPFIFCVSRNIKYVLALTQTTMQGYAIPVEVSMMSTKPDRALYQLKSVLASS